MNASVFVTDKTNPEENKFYLLNSYIENNAVYSYAPLIIERTYLVLIKNVFFSENSV